MVYRASWAGDGSSLQAERPANRRKTIRRHAFHIEFFLASIHHLLPQYLLVIKLLEMAHLHVSLVHYVVCKLDFLITHGPRQPMCNHILLKLTHELHIVKRVYLQLRQLVIEATLAHLRRLRDVRLHRELFAGRLSVCVAAFAHL